MWMEDETALKKALKEPQKGDDKLEGPEEDG
jgi:hypothetical protein